MADAATRAKREHEGFGPDDPEAPANNGQTLADVQTRARARGDQREATGVFADTTPTQADRASQKREARSGERATKAATQPSPKTSSRPSASRRGAGSSPGGRGLGSIGSRAGGVEDVGGAILAIFGYGLLINFLRGGPTQVRAWLAAKFLNKVSTANPSTGTIPHGDQVTPQNPNAPTGPGNPARPGGSTPTPNAPLGPNGITPLVDLLPGSV